MSVFVTMQRVVHVAADDLPGEPSVPIMYLLHFIGSSHVAQPEYVNELSSSCRQCLAVSNLTPTHMTPTHSTQPT